MARGIEPEREPLLGQIFSKAGYKTEIFGKSQPLKTKLVNLDQTEQERAEQVRKQVEWRMKNFLNPGLPIFMRKSMLLAKWLF